MAKPPPKDSFTGVVLAGDTGPSATDFITNNGAVTFSGTVSDLGGPGIKTVKVYNGSALLGTATVVNGIWKLATTLAEGTYNALKVVATDIAGLSTTAFNPTAIVIDKTPPVLKISSQTLAKDSGASATDLVTSNGGVTLKGTASGLTGTVQIFDGTTAIGTAAVDGQGNWTFTTTLGNGTHALHAVASDKAGNSTTTAAQPSIVVDTTTPTVSFSYEDQVVGSSSVQLWGSVTGTAGTKVEIWSGTTDLGTATITGNTWHFDTPALAAGNYSFTAIATTLAGNSSTFGGIPSLTVGPVSGTLDPTRYATVWKQDFTTSTQINTNIFPIVYGNPDEFSFGANGLTITSYRSEGFNNVGFLQPNWGAGLSQGYGLYSITASTPAGQGGGIAILLWPADNIWPGPEMDMVEDWTDPTGQTAVMTVHFKGPDGSNMQDAIKFHVNLSASNTFAMDWERGSLTYYLNGSELFQITGSEVPKDFADGGVNSAFGAQITDIGTNYEPTDQVSLTISQMSYSTVGAPPASISISSPGTVQEKALGAAVPVTETITGVSLSTSTVYAMVLNSSNAAYVNWQAVTLDGNGVGTFVANYYNSGDYLVVTTDPANQVIKGWSDPVTVLPPPLGLAVTASARLVPAGAMVATASINPQPPDSQGWQLVDHTGGVLGSLDVFQADAAPAFAALPAINSPDAMFPAMIPGAFIPAGSNHWHWNG